MFSTLHKDTEVEPNGAQKPKIMLDYNQGKCGVDTFVMVYYQTQDDLYSTNIKHILVTCLNSKNKQ